MGLGADSRARFEPDGRRETYSAGDARKDYELVKRVLTDPGGVSDRFAQRMRCVPRILGALNARMGRPLDEHDLEDLAQDAVIIVLRKLEQFIPGYSLEGWVYRICKLELMNRVRSKRRLPRLLVDDVACEPASGGGSGGGAPLDEHEEVYRGLACLEPDEEAVIRLKYLEDLTFEQLSERLGIPLGTAKTRHYRAMLKLHAFLQNRYGESDRD